MKTVYSYDEDNYYNGTDVAYKSPLEEDVYLMPARTTDVAPPEELDGFKLKFNGVSWEYESIIGMKFFKDKLNTTMYSNVAKWCNETQLATIEDKGEYYECVAIPQPSDEEKLAEAKEDKVAELKSIRDSLEVEPIQTDKGLFDYDQKAMDRINGAIIALSLQDGATLEWTLADNTTATVSAVDLKMVVGAVAIRSNILHNKYRVLKEQVMACETVEQVNDIEWSSNT